MELCGNPVAFSLSILVQITYYINSEGLRIQHVLLLCVKLLTSVKVLGLKMVFACSLQTVQLSLHIIALLC